MQPSENPIAAAKPAAKAVDAGMVPALGIAVERHPVLAYLLLCFGITWSVWFCVPLVAGADWALGKVVTGAGFGPAMAAIVLDRMRGTGGKIGSSRWWTGFFVVFAAVGAIDVLNLLLGDGITATDFSTAQPSGLTPVGVISSLTSPRTPLTRKRRSGTARLFSLSAPWCL